MHDLKEIFVPKYFFKLASAFKSKVNVEEEIYIKIKKKFPIVQNKNVRFLLFMDADKLCTVTFAYFMYILEQNHTKSFNAVVV